MTLPVLQTPRLVLRPPEQRDADFIVTAMQDRRVWYWLDVIPQPYTHADAVHFIENIAPGDAWLIERNGAAQGIIGGARGNLGYWLAPQSWGKGIATEAGDAVIDYIFGQGADQLLSGYHGGNDRSRSTLEKLGFVDDGPKTMGCLSDGRTDIPSRAMRLSRARWEQRRRLNISTPRLTIRELRDSDAPAFARICGHPDVAPNLFAMTVGWPEKDAAAMIRASRYRGRIPFRAAIMLGDRMIGTCGIGGIGSRTAPSIMYAIDPAQAGQGFATEAMLAFLDWIDATLAPPVIEADHFTDNPASGAVLRKLGFRLSGTAAGPSAARAGDHPIDTYRRKTLHTDRLILRPMRPADLPVMMDLLSHWHVTRQLASWPWPPDRDFTATRCETFTGNGDIWAIIKDAKMIGTVGVNAAPSGGAGIGYSMHPDHHGNGYATEAARAALTHAFATYDWDEITAGTWHDNPASGAVLRKLGFRETGKETQFAKARQANVTMHRYSLARP